MTSAPPGWYPDASQPGLERWWDGGAWSEVTRPAPGAEQASQPPGRRRRRSEQPYGQHPYGRSRTAAAVRTAAARSRRTGTPQYQYPAGNTAAAVRAPIRAPGSRRARRRPTASPTANPWRRLGAGSSTGIIVGLVVLVIGFPLVRDLIDQFRRLPRPGPGGGGGGPTDADVDAPSSPRARRRLKLTLLQLIVAAIYQIPHDQAPRGDARQDGPPASGSAA